MPKILIHSVMRSFCTIIFASTWLFNATCYGLFYEAKGVVVEGDVSAMDGSVVVGETDYVSVMEFNYSDFSLVEETILDQAGGWTTWLYKFSTTASVFFQAGNYIAGDEINNAWLSLARQADDPAGRFQWRVNFDANYSTSDPEGYSSLYLQIPLIDSNGNQMYLDLSSSFGWFGFSTGFFGQMDLDPSSMTPDFGAALAQLESAEVSAQGNYLASWFGTVDNDGMRNGIFNGRDYPGATEVPDASSSGVLAGLGLLALVVARRRFAR